MCVLVNLNWIERIEYELLELRWNCECEIDFAYNFIILHSVATLLELCSKLIHSIWKLYYSEYLFSMQLFKLNDTNSNYSNSVLNAIIQAEQYQFIHARFQLSFQWHIFLSTGNQCISHHICIFKHQLSQASNISPVLHKVVQ